MLTRRSFAGLTSWAICAVAGFVETDALAAQEAPRAVTLGVSAGSAIR
jgi:hypothetical protein